MQCLQRKHNCNRRILKTTQKLPSKADEALKASNLRGPVLNFPHNLFCCCPPENGQIDQHVTSFRGKGLQ